MKKIALIFWVLVFVCLIGCAQNTPEDTTNNIHIDHGSIIYRTMEEYNEFIRTSDLPNEFVHASSLSLLGEFDSIQLDWYGGYNSYSYLLKDDTNHKLGIDVRHNRKAISAYNQLLTLPEGTTTMANIVVPGTGGYEFARKNITYFYRDDGKLYSITLQIDSVELVLTSGYNFDYYLTDGKQTIMDQLMSISEVESGAAFTELKACINEKA